jgi:hypothetical protein
MRQADIRDPTIRGVDRFLSLLKAAVAQFSKLFDIDEALSSVEKALDIKN